jgi:dTDP-4-amino-4,6-dideoxygalactose transaminase
LKIPFGRPLATDEDRHAVMQVLEGSVWTQGPQLQAFETEFAAFVGGGAHCVAVSSGMAALHLAHLHLGIGRGDEVIVPALTHVATAHAVELVGARPVFVDCDAATGNPTAATIAGAIGERTRAISIVHFAGIPCPMDGILELVRRHGLGLVEDCALAVGARHRERHVGSFGDVGCFSFYPAKHLSTGEGGMCVTRDAAVAAALGRLRAFGVDRGAAGRAVPGLYDVPSLGLNYRMGEMPAALGRVQLARIRESLERRSANFRALRRALVSVPGLRVLDAPGPDSASSHYCLVVVLEGALARRRDDLARALHQAGIGTSVYYPHPVPRLAYYARKYGYDASRFPCAAEISDRSLALPVGPHLAPADVAFVGDQFQRAAKELGA